MNTFERNRRASREAHLESSAALASGVDPRDARRASRRVALKLLARDPELARVAQVSPSSFVRAARKAGLQEADANDSELIRDIADVADRYARATGVGGKIPTSTGGVGGSRGAPGPRKPRGIPEGLDPRSGGLRDHLGGGGLGRGGDGGLGGWDRTAKYLPGASDGRGALIDLAPPDKNVRSIIGPGDAGDLDERIDGVLDALGLPPQRRNRSAVDEGQSRKRNVGEAQLPMGAWNRVNPGESVSEDPQSPSGRGGSAPAAGAAGENVILDAGGYRLVVGTKQAGAALVGGTVGAAGGAVLGARGGVIGALIGAGVGGFIGFNVGYLGGGLADRIDKHRPSDDDSGTGPAGPRALSYRPADDGTGPVAPSAAGRAAPSTALRADVMPTPDGDGPPGPWSRFGRYGKPSPDDPNPGGPAGRLAHRAS